MVAYHDYGSVVETTQRFFASRLFHDVQMAGLFADSKTFADAIPVDSFEQAIKAYEQQHGQPGFDLQAFVAQHFLLPTEIELPLDNGYRDMADYIEKLWPKLCRQPDQANSGSLLPLFHSYLVPGGRFREIYYWDSYFTALGLMVSGRDERVVDMIKNFLELQAGIGLIPNGNRSYYVSRSQPPVLALMTELISGPTGDFSEAHKLALLPDFVNGLEAEYRFWMQGAEELNSDNPTHRRVVRMPDGSILNRYWDDDASPRPESYREDCEAVQEMTELQQREYFRNIRAACESGWDFSSRWLANSEDLRSIRTTQLVPVDLNCLLYNLELRLAEYWQTLGDEARAAQFNYSAQRRQQSINRYCWDASAGLFYDYDLEAQRGSTVASLATCLPLFCGLASQDQALGIARRLKADFLVAGGLLTTTNISPQQWDRPNGWAPLQWFAVRGLYRYGLVELAESIVSCWCNTVDDYFNHHQVLMEKYDLVERMREAAGGEYEVQHGFGWTNGVTSAFTKGYHRVPGAR